MLGTQEFDVLWLSMTVRRLFINNAVFDVENSQSVLRSRLYLIFIIVCYLFFVNNNLHWSDCCFDLAHLCLGGSSVRLHDRCVVFPQPRSQSMIEAVGRSREGVLYRRFMMVTRSVLSKHFSTL